MTRYILAAILVALAALAAPAQAEETRSISEVPSRVAYVRDSSIGNGASAEAIDLADLATFTTNHRTFSCLIVNEDGSNDLLVDFSSVSASELTTPANDTVTSVVAIQESDSITFTVQVRGWVWQSAAGNVAARATCTY